MKKIIILLFATTIISNSFATSNIEIKDPPILNASKILIPIGKSGKVISLLELSKISRTDLETLTGKKMRFIERIAFKNAQKKLSKGINENGIVVDKKINKFFGRKRDDKTSGFHVLGFVLGFFLGLIGVLLAYVINDDEDKKNRVKWAWLGFVIGWLLIIGLYVILISSAL